MLVLSRFEGESIVIGDDIEIRLVRVRPRAKVRIGIVAPPHVNVLRFELAQADAQKRASGTRFASSLSNSKARANSKAKAKIPERSPNSNSNSKRTGSTVRAQEGAGT